MAPSPTPQTERGGRVRPLDDPLAGFIFKIQANLDPRHRDRIAFMRVCSGRFERGVALTNHRTGRSTSTKYAHQMFGRDRDTVDIAFPGDIVGLVNASDLSIGDSLSADGKANFRTLPTFAPEHFRLARNLDTSRYKQFRRGIAQLDDEGVIQALHTRDRGEREPILGAVGEMQFEVALYRLEAEFGAKVRLDPVPYRLARRTDEDGRTVASSQRGVEVAERRDGTLLALFPSENMLNVTRRDHPDIVLESIVGL
jgi:peptide chain release factor 3